MILIWFLESGPLVYLLHCRHVGLGVFWVCFGFVCFLFSSKSCVVVSKLLLEAVMLQWCNTLTRLIYHFSYWWYILVYCLEVVLVCHYSTSFWREGESLCAFINKKYTYTYIHICTYFTHIYSICALYNKHIHAIHVYIIILCVYMCVCIFICVHTHFFIYIHTHT